MDSVVKTKEVLYFVEMADFVCIVGNSIIRNWNRERNGPIQIKVMPGAALDTLIEGAKEFRCPGAIVFIQSGIPDLHIRGILDIEEDKLEIYKRALVKVNVTLEPPVVILPIYPPYGSSDYVCTIYADLNYYIRSLNTLETPNTSSRIFHRLVAGGWRIDTSRLSDGIHPTEREGQRIYRRLVEYVEKGSDFSRVGNCHAHVEETRENERTNSPNTEEPISVPLYKDQTSSPMDKKSRMEKQAITRTINNELATGDRSPPRGIRPTGVLWTEEEMAHTNTSCKVSDLLKKKEIQLEKLKEFTKKMEGKIERECVERIKQELQKTENPLQIHPSPDDINLMAEWEKEDGSS